MWRGRHCYHTVKHWCCLVSSIILVFIFLFDLVPVKGCFFWWGGGGGGVRGYVTSVRSDFVILFFFFFCCYFSVPFCVMLDSPEHSVRHKLDKGWARLSLTTVDGKLVSEIRWRCTLRACHWTLSARPTSWFTSARREISWSKASSAVTGFMGCVTLSRCSFPCMDFSCSFCYDTKHDLQSDVWNSVITLFLAKFLITRLEANNC